MANHIQSYLFIDGPNIDMTLGSSILARKPGSMDRPRWDSVARYAEQQLRCSRPTFVLNGNTFSTGGSKLYAFRRALQSFRFAVECPKGSIDDGDPVDQFILEQLQIISRFNRPCSVAVMSHDHGYADSLSSLAMLGNRVTVIGFVEELAPQLLKLENHGVGILDLEHHLCAFDAPLPRPYVTVPNRCLLPSSG